MANWNSVSPFTQATIADVVQAAGVTQFAGDGLAWFHVVNGLIIQGGLHTPDGTTPDTVVFPTGFPTQVLGVFVQPIGAASTVYLGTVTLADFVANYSGTPTGFYWWAIGV